jgi:hypothetical protein
MFHLLKPCLGLLCVGAVLPTWSASASVAYSTLDSLGHYDVSTAEGVNGPTPYGYQAHGDSFISQASGTLSSIDLALHYLPNVSSPADQVNVSLELNRVDPVYGDLPSNISLWSGVANTPSPFGDAGLVTLSPATGAALVQGQKYWLVVTPYFGNTVVEWNVSTATYGGIALSLNGTSWGQNPSGLQDAFRVQVVPEPGAAALGVLASALMLFRRRQE